MNNETKVIAGIGIATLVLVIIGAFLFSKAPTTSDQVVSEENAQLLIKSDSHQTLENAPVAVIEFADLQCPACGSVHPILQRLKEDYKDKVNFVYRHFPLDGHKNAFAAALASEAASEQGKFWEMENKLFGAQEEWSESNEPNDIFVKYAAELKLNIEKFQSDIEANKYVDKIKADYNDGLRLGVMSTPTFFINNKKYAGGMSLNEFKTLIDEALNN